MWNDIKDKYNNFLKKYPLLFRLFLASIVTFMVWSVFTLVTSEGARNYWFSTGDDHFQWVGISALVAGIALCVNAYDNRRKFKADLVSQSKIKWINEMKEDMTEFTSLLGTYDYTSIQLTYSKLSSQSDYRDKLKKLNLLEQEIIKETYKLDLDLFGEDEDIEHLEKAIDKCSGKRLDFRKVINDTIEKYQKEHRIPKSEMEIASIPEVVNASDALDASIVNVLNYASTYLEHKWIEAKLEKESNH